MVSRNDRECIAERIATDGHWGSGEDVAFRYKFIVYSSVLGFEKKNLSRNFGQF
jgi:hypothetical protein